MGASDDAKLLFSQGSAEQLRNDFPDDVTFEGIQLFRAVRFLARQMNEATTTLLAPFGVSAKKYNYLAVLYLNRRTGLTSGELGAMVRTTSGSVTVMLDTLEREGIVARRAHPSDGRSIIIKLTPKGVQLYLKSAAAQHQLLTDVLATLGRDRAKRLQTLLVDAGSALHAATEHPGGHAHDTNARNSALHARRQ